MGKRSKGKSKQNNFGRAIPKCERRAVPARNRSPFAALYNKSLLVQKGAPREGLRLTPAKNAAAQVAYGYRAVHVWDVDDHWPG